MGFILNGIIIVLIILMWWDLRGGKTPFISRTRKQVLIDTSILIDGRFLAVSKTGFTNFQILIPRSVVGELQTLADGGDDIKRVRARYGLDVISALQKQKNLDVDIFADGIFAEEGVDNRLISLAKKHKMSIMTADYNLNKVAKVEGIEVLNINELVQSVRADYLPGEKIVLEITQRGNEKKQGIGHLPDGTMVVVENGESLVGTISEIEFIRSLQTAAGKMMFARPVDLKISKVENQKIKGKSPVKSAIKSHKKAQKDVNKKSSKSKVISKKINSKKSKKSKTIKKQDRKNAEENLIRLANER